MRARRIAVVVVAIVALALLTPELVDVYSELADARSLSRWWLVAMLVAVVVQFLANVVLHRIVLRTSEWLDVGAPLLTGNAVSHVVPGGNAIGAGVQIRMLTVAGFPLASVLPALGAVTIIGLVGGFVALPLVVLAASAAGSDIDPRLIAPMWIGVAVLTIAMAAVVLAAIRDRPWHLLARAIAAVQARLRRPADAPELERRLLGERDLIVDALRQRRGLATTAEVGRQVGDFVALYCAMRATGAAVNPAAVMAAFIVANLAGMIPLTPGGLGFVETGLTGVISLAGASAAQANLGVAVYRLGATWLPCLVSVAVLAWFQHRHREHAFKELLVTRRGP